MDKLYIIIPAYNEEENIESVVNDWYPIVESYNGDGESRLVIINDGSRDSTFDKLKKLSETRPKLMPITKDNSGHGATILFGYKYAIEKNADYIFQTDSDGQTLPEEFHDFWKLRDKYDMVIGDRSGRQDGISRVFVTKTLKTVIRLCFRVKVTDANTPFRLMKTETLKKYIALIPEDFNLSNVLISVIYAKFRRKVKYIHITFRPRQGGVNSINMKKIFKIGRQALSDFRQINRSLSKAKKEKQL
ncbi:MAG: glycosyltransferase family 2 protein [Lachnospiraceae bacterium]|nr:glycosyltransferase family 2 protein [Lachnospiraceae bacterium]